MEILQIKSPDTIVPSAPRAVALGLFDGVHLGHRRVMMNAVGVDGLTASVFSFGREAAALKPDAKALCTASRMAHVLETIGIDEWIEADFAAFRDQTSEEFVEKTLDRQLGARRVCCGFNFRFGKGGAGDVDTLRRLCAERGIEVLVADEV
ncbi:MAG: hypothetical protein IJU16_07270, partial [Clostridia bacterium]|nr:hypothetical protein [Clostridia bacterium]